mmetsp:Transcript_11570/g.32041  ORF Transcript_11570/g.32041 Transcript_11570/m.32041 type:complete len:591 (+) Transcript_11570:152-1924(+)
MADVEQGNKQEKAKGQAFSPSTPFGTPATDRDSLTSRRTKVRRMISLNSFSAVDTKIIQTTISNLSNDHKDPHRLYKDSQQLYEAVRATGSHAYGIVAIEVWNMNRRTSRLEAAQGGLWISPVLSEHQNNKAAQRLLDPTHPEYEPPECGYGLVGDLWMRARTKSPRSSRTTKTTADSPKREASPEFVGLTRVIKDDQSDTRNDEAYFIQKSYQHYGHALQWRDMNTLWLDPDTPKTHRLKVMLDAGLGHAAAVPFSEYGEEGLVVYFVRPSANRTVVSAMENQEFLYRQAKLLGVLISSSVAGRALEAARQRALRASWKQFVRNLKRHHCSKIPGSETSWSSHDDVGRSDLGTTTTTTTERAPNPHSALTKMWVVSTKHVKYYLQKWKGGNGQIAAPLSIQQSTWTLLGSFLGLLLLSAYNEWIQDETNGDYELLIGPFGAAMTLLYGLHSAPASQPRNVVLGQVVAGAVSLVFTYIPEDILPVWIRRAVGPAFAIAAMTALGVIHPPAGAHSVIYASGSYNWVFYVLVVIGAMISVAPAVIVNNLSNRRQYPLYWGYWSEYLRLQLRRFGRNKELQFRKNGTAKVYMT